MKLPWKRSKKVPVVIMTTETFDKMLQLMTAGTTINFLMKEHNGVYSISQSVLETCQEVFPNALSDLKQMLKQNQTIYETEIEL